MASPAIWLATRLTRIGASAGSSVSSRPTRRRTWVTTNSRISRAVHSLLIAERSSATPAVPGRRVPDASGTSRTSRSPTSSAAAGERLRDHLGRVDRGVHRGQEELVLGAEVVVHQRRVDLGAGRDARGSTRRRSPSRRRRCGRPPGSPRGCPGCRAAGRSVVPSSLPSVGRRAARRPRRQGVRRRRWPRRGPARPRPRRRRCQVPPHRAGRRRRARRPRSAPRPRRTAAARR